MKHVNLVCILALASIVVIYKIATRNTANPSATGGTPVQPMGAPDVDAITEAAYHQDASGFAPAVGASENTSGEEVTSLQ